MDFPATISLVDDAVVILDQSRLPLNEVYVRLASVEDVFHAIKRLRVRGAPAIGIAAAMGMYVHMKSKAAENSDIGFLISEFGCGSLYLSASRPTAVNLDWALARMKRVFFGCVEQTGISAADILEALRKEALLILQEDTEVCKKIGEHGFNLLKQDMGVLTHCNAGSLAASRYGTALAPIYIAQEGGVKLRVYADETRPVLQGARLTTFELVKAGVDVTLICDNAAAVVMSKKLVDIVLVGSDRVASNGDTANKIGTLSLAILAKKFGIPFYVCAPFSTIDIDTETGNDIVIEERDDNEITEMWYQERMAPPEVKTFNPAFDVTPAELITGFITEKGVLLPPFCATDSKSLPEPSQSKGTDKQGFFRLPFD